MMEKGRGRELRGEDDGEREGEGYCEERMMEKGRGGNCEERMMEKGRGRELRGEDDGEREGEGTARRG